MDKVWLNKEKNSSCILFFNGWGMSVNSIKHLDTQGFDVCVLQNYDDNFSVDESDLDYGKIYVVAWSLGVCIANSYLLNTKLNIVKSIALNGTPYGMHDKWGISEQIFLLTMKTWNDRNRNKFNLRMCGGKAQYDKLSSFLVSRDPEQQRNELIYLHAYILNYVLGSSSALYEWNKVYIASVDLIIASANQLSFWTDKTEIKTLDSGHFPFHKFESWSNIID